MEERNRTTTRNWTEWVDSEGRLHSKVIRETIITPTNIRQATFPKFPEFGFSQKCPGLWNPVNIPEPKNFFGNNMPEKPLLSREHIKACIEAGQKFLKESGIKIEDLFKSEESKTEETKPLKTGETVKSKEVNENAKGKKETRKKSQKS